MVSGLRSRIPSSASLPISIDPFVEIPARRLDGHRPQGIAWRDTLVRADDVVRPAQTLKPGGIAHRVPMWQYYSDGALLRVARRGLADGLFDQSIACRPVAGRAQASSPALGLAVQEFRCRNVHRDAEFFAQEGPPLSSSTMPCSASVSYRFWTGGPPDSVGYAPLAVHTCDSAVCTVGPRIPYESPPGISLHLAGTDQPTAVPVPHRRPAAESGTDR